MGRGVGRGAQGSVPTSGRCSMPALRLLALLAALGPTASPATLRGFNSYLGYCDGQPNETEIRSMMDYVQKELAPSGYTMFGMDVGWAGSIDAHGRMQPDPVKYPSSRGGKGFGPIISQAHQRGLRFGLRIWRGIHLSAVKQRSAILGTNYTADEVVRWDRNCTWGGGYWPGSDATWLGLNMSHPGGQAYYNSLVDM